MSSISHTPKSMRGFAFDLDGTLLRSDHSLSNAVCAAVRALANNGVPVVLVSARPPRSVLSIAAQLHLSGSMVTLNGALVANTDGEIIEATWINSSALLGVLALMEQYKTLTAHYYSGFEWFVIEENANVRFESKTMGFGPTIADGPDLIVRANKILVVGEAALLDDLRTEIVAHGWSINVIHSKPTYLEITDVAVTKATGLETVSREVQLGLENFTAFGDGDNDISLLLACGQRVAMGNGSEALKAIATTVIGTNDDDAIARYFSDEAFEAGLISLSEVAG